MYIIPIITIWVAAHFRKTNSEFCEMISEFRLHRKCDITKNAW